MIFPQEKKICDPKGRDCIERNFAKSFNCNTTCEGIYADVEWVGNKIEEDTEDDKDQKTIEVNIKREVGEELDKVYKQLAELKKEVKLLKRSGGDEKGEELDKEKYKMLIAEYRKYKRQNVKHFRFISAADSGSFGKS